MKVLFICKDRGAYKHGKYGLWNSANLVIKEIGSNFDCKLITTIDGNTIDRDVYINKPDIVILEAIWVTPEKVKELHDIYPNIIWIIRIHSKATFLANEGVAFNWIYKYKKIDNVFVSTNNEEFNNDLNSINNTNKKFIYLPNIYTIEYNFNKVYNKYETNILNIGCFGALRPMKNHINQAIACIIFADKIGKKLNFHINVNSENNGENVIKNLRALFDNSNHSLVEHEWMPHDEFCNLVKQMDIGIQVSLSESFNIVSADFIFATIPIVASKEIKFVNSLCKCNNETNEIVRTLFFAYYGGYIGLNTINKVLLNSHNKKSKNIWNEFLNEKKIRTNISEIQKHYKK